MLPLHIVLLAGKRISDFYRHRYHLRALQTAKIYAQPHNAVEMQPFGGYTDDPTH